MAITDALAEAGVVAIHAEDLLATRASWLRDLPRTHYARVSVSGGDESNFHSELLINASPAGMRPSDPLPIPRKMLQPGRLVAKIAMTPKRTPLLIAAEAAGCNIHNGAPMLLTQMDRMVAFFAGR